MGSDLKEFYQVFFEEAAELLADMERLLLGLDVAAPQAEDLNAIFRAAHSIKGGAATFGFTDMAQLTHTLESLLDRLRPRTDGRSYLDLKTSVADRPGHDKRYAIDAGKINRDLGWKPQESFESGIAKTIDWYLSNPEWIAHVVSGEYRTWMEKQYGK